MFRTYLLSFTTLLLLNVNISAQSSYGLLWEITGNGLESPSYLYGTVHLRDPRVFLLGDSIYYAIQSSPAFALEIDMDSIQVYLCRRISENDDTTSTDRWSKDHHDKKAGKIKKPVKGSTEGNLPHNFLDLYLHRVAREEGKLIYGLEPYSNHLDVMGKKGEWSKEEDFHFNHHLNALIEQYVEGDLEAIEEMFRDVELDTVHGLKRNMDMLNSIMEISKTTGLFAAVGTAHLFGKDGLVALLGERGYHLRRMQPGAKKVPEEFNEVIPYESWTTLTDPGKRFTVRMPGETCNTVTQDGMNIHAYIDPYTGHSYAIGVTMPDINVSEKTLLDFISNNMKALHGKARNAVKPKQLKSTDPEKQGVFVKDNDGNYDFEYRYIFHNGFIYYLFQGQPANITELDSREAFFNSLVFLQQSHSTISFSDEKGAFELSLPGTPIFQSIDLAEGEDPDARKLYQWMFADNEKKNQYLVQYFDLNYNDVYGNEELLMEGMLSNLGILETSEHVTGDTSEINGYDVQTHVYRLSDGSYMGLKYLLRGNRLYLLLKTALTAVEVTDPFFLSFQLRPFNESTMTLMMVNNGEFSIEGPGPWTVIPDSSFYHYAYETHKWTFFNLFDPNNSAVIGIEKAELSPYFSYTWSDSLLKEFNGFFTIFGDSLTESDHQLSGYDSHRIRMSSEKGNTKVVEYFLAGNHLYAINVMVPDEMAESGYAENVISSFRLLKQPEPPPLRHGSALLLDDLVSADSIRQAKAHYHISQVKFSDEDFDRISEYALRQWPDDNDQYGTRSELIAALVEKRREKALPVLRQITNQLDTADAYINALVPALLFINTDESLKLADSILSVDSLYTQLLAYRVLTHYYDSVELFLQHGHMIMSHFQKPKMTQPAVYLLERFLEDTVDLQPYLSTQVEFLLHRFYEKKDSVMLQEEDIYLHAYDLSNLIELINAAGAVDRILPLLPDLHAVNNHEVNQAILLVQMMNNIPYDEKVMSDILKDTLMAPQFVLKAVNRNVFDKIPAGLYHEETIASLDLLSLIYEEAYPSDFVLREKRNIPNIKENGDYYIFDIRFEGDPETYIGVSGPFPVRRNNGYANNGTTYSYTPVTDENYEKVLMEIFQEHHE